MRKMHFMFVIVAAAVLAGCGTTRTAKIETLENRVQNLENRVVVLETGSTPSGIVVSEASAPVVSERTSSGVTVETLTKKQLQEALKNAGYYEGAIDGKIGPKTKAALREFQSEMGLKVDGIAGPKTKAKLLKYLP